MATVERLAQIPPGPAPESSILGPRCQSRAKEARIEALDTNLGALDINLYA